MVLRKYYRKFWGVYVCKLDDCVKTVTETLTCLYVLPEITLFSPELLQCLCDLIPV